MTILESLADAATAVAAPARRLVVGVGRNGSGFVLDDGLVATNAHNVRGNEVTIAVGGSARSGRVAGIDPDTDLAVVAVDTDGLAPVSWGQAPSVGMPVFALADPAGSGLRLTFGVVSSVGVGFRVATGRRISGFEHTAPLPRGSSGGLVVDGAARALGVNTHRLGEGFYVAVPADESLRERLAALARGEVPQRRRLGVAIAPSHVARRLRAAVGLPEREGLLVRAVEEGGPADRAGLREGDLLVHAAGRDLVRADDLHAALEETAAQPEVAVRLVRGAEEREIRITFA